MPGFHRLIEQQIPRLRRYAQALTRNDDRADDLVQDTHHQNVNQITRLARAPTGRVESAPMTTI